MRLCKYQNIGPFKYRIVALIISISARGRLENEDYDIRNVHLKKTPFIEKSIRISMTL